MTEQARSSEEISQIIKALESVRSGLRDDQLSITRPRCLTTAELSKRDIDMIVAGLELADRIRTVVKVGDVKEIDLAAILNNNESPDRSEKMNRIFGTAYILGTSTHDSSGGMMK